MKNLSKNSLTATKDKHFKNEKVVVFNYLKEHVATASMVTDATSIKQKNITRFKREFEISGMLCQLFQAPCKSTGCKAWYLTTNPALFKPNPQTSLFDKNGGANG